MLINGYTDLIAGDYSSSKFLVQFRLE